MKNSSNYAFMAQPNGRAFLTVKLFYSASAQKGLNMNIINMPSVISETTTGYFQTSIQTEMFKRREIQCIGEIDESSVNAIILQILQLNNVNPEEEITLYINSPGGSVQDGLALYDVMQAINCPIRTVCVGMAASMAALLFISGNRREMLPHSKIMIHDPRIMNTGGTALEIEAISKNIMEIRQLTAEVIAKHSNNTVEQILEKTKIDSYFSPKEAIEFGLADTVIEHI